MISDKFALEQINRLVGLDFFPRNEPAALKELKLALMAAATEGIASRVIDRILIEQIEAPKPKQLRDMAMDYNGPAQNFRCEKCLDSGIVFLVDRAISGVSDLLQNSKPCDCPAGAQWRKEYAA